MSRSPVISTLLILVIFIASEVLSASREARIPPKLRDGEFVETREAEVLDERSRRLIQNERFDVSKEDELLHRESRVAKESLASSNENEKKPMEVEKKIGNSISSGETSEIKDMNESHVTPQDDDDNDDDDTKKEKKILTKVMEHPANVTSDSNNSEAPKIFPDDDRVQSISDASPAMVERLNKTNYTIDGTNITKNSGKTNETIAVTVNVVPMTSSTISPTIVRVTTILPPTAAPTAANTSTPSTKTSAKITTPAPKATSMSTTTTTSAPKIVPKANVSTTTTELPTINSEIVADITPTTEKLKPSSPSPAEKLLHEKKMPEQTMMPRGVVALITAITFSIVVVTVYIGLIIRRRFVEWRHGNRELLVNEFDATDISNFEL